MSKLIRKLLDRLAPFTVHVIWEAEIVVHKAHTAHAALEWMKCYPADAVVRVLNRRGDCLGIRFGQWRTV